MQIKIEQIEKDLKEKKINEIYILYGKEKFLLENCLKKIIKNFGETIDGINYIKIYENNIQELISNIETPAFGYEKKIIVVRDSKLFEKASRKKDKNKEEYIQTLIKYFNENIEDIKNSTILVFIEDVVEKNELYNAIEKYSTICNFEQLKTNEIIERIKSICKAYKVEITNADINYLIEQCGINMQDLINEVRKLIEYVGENGLIKKQYIDLLCIKQIQAVIFDLTDNLGKKDIKNSIKILENLIYSKEPIQKILVTLYNHFKKLLITKIAIEENKNIAESLNLKPNQMFLTNKYKIQSGYFTKKELRKIVQDLTNLDSNYKRGLIELEIGIKTLLCSI